MVDLMDNENFCGVENYSVLIPYGDLVKMVEMAKKVEQIEEQYARLHEQYAAIVVCSVNAWIKSRKSANLLEIRKKIRSILIIDPK